MQRRRVHLVRGGEGVGGAGVDAARAGAATVGGGECELVWLECEGRDDDGEEEPRAELLVEDAGVFADPADACIAGVDALDDGAGIDEAAGLEGAEFGEELVAEFFQAAEQDFVVIRGAFAVGGPGVAGDPAGSVGSGVGGARLGGIVIGGADNHGARPG